MLYDKKDAKAYARETMRGIWAATLTPFRPDDLSVDEAGYGRNIEHWVQALGIDGLFVSGKQGEFFSMSVAERKRSFEIAVEAAAGRAGVLASASDQNLDTVIELARHAEKVGCGYVVVHSPILHFHKDIDEPVHEYYRYIAERIGIGLVLWSHPDAGYLMSPDLVSRVADIENVVAIKYSVPRDMYARLTRIAGDKLIVSTASEEEWLDNILELDWRVYLCSTPPYLLQGPADRRMRDYTDLAFAGDAAGAKRVWESLEPVRKALKGTRPGDKPHAQQKYWQELLGQVGGPVRRPLLNLTDAEKAAVREAFDACGLKPA